MKVLLVQPFKDFGLKGESYPPVGLGYLANALRQGRHNVSLIDCLQNNYSYKKFIGDVDKAGPDLIGINLFSISLPFVARMIDMIKEKSPATVVVLGGPHVSSLPEKTLVTLAKADFAIRGEGEVPFRKLVDYLESGNNNFRDIPGLIYRESGKSLMNEPYFAENIEDYGMPAWDLINPRSYFKYIGIGQDSAPVFLSRGCPFPCTFCAAKVTSGRSLRHRGIGHIFQELQILQDDYGIHRFILEDEGFGVSKNFIMDFCRRVREENFKAQFAMGVGMRLDIIDRELLESMKASNFEKTIVLGIESGSERILKLMNKLTNLRMISEKVDLMNGLGFEPTGYFILGYPQETKEEMEETVRLALKLNIKEASFTAFQPLPGTEATQQLMQNRELPEDFDFTALAQNKISYAPSGTTVEELSLIRKSAILRFYLRPKILARFLANKRAFVYAVRKFIAVFLKKNIINGK